MNDTLLIGSVALKHHGLLDRKPVDRDVIVRPHVMQRAVTDPDLTVKYVNGSHVAVWPKAGQQYGIVDMEVAWPGSTAEELLDMSTDKVADLNTLYALKMSHRYKKNSPHFYKTMADIKRMREAGAVIPADMMDWYKRRERETYAYSHPKLNQSKKDFFTDDVPYTWDHDDIHKVVARGNRPAYLEYLVPGEEVKCSREMFEECSAQSRINGVYEESMVLAIERSIYPYNVEGPEGWEKSFRFALMKVCTSITSGWFREFAWENHDEVAAMFDYEREHRQWTAALKNNEVREYKYE